MRLDAGGFGSGSLLLSGNNGPPGATFYLLTTTNVLDRAGGWIPIATNQFDAFGRFTRQVPADSPARLYRVQVP
jgi:hypothetical protein